MPFCGPGKWAIVLDIYDDNGKSRRKWHTFHTTSKRKAEEECARLIAEMRGGTYIEPDKTTLAAFFDRWLEHVEPTVSPGTHWRYAWLAKKNIAPLIGDVLLSKLKTERIDRAWTQALQSGRMDGKGGLSPCTVHHMRRVLIKALNQAVTWDILPKNPALASNPPKVDRKKKLAYDATQTAEFLDALRPTRMFIPARCRSPRLL